MSGRLDKALEWATMMVPVKVCRACKVPAVGFITKTYCPNCGIETVFDPRTGITAPWDKSRQWAPDGCLVVVSERTL